MPLQIECIKALAQCKSVAMVNIHARPDDEFTLCSGCGRRLINLKTSTQRCDWCLTYVREYQYGESLALNNFQALESLILQGAKILGEAGKRLNIENTYESPSLIKRLLINMPSNVGFTLDSGHALISPASPLDYIYLLRDRLDHLHVHDNMGGNTEWYHDLHLPPGSGVLPWVQIARALRQIHFKGTATFECIPNNLWVECWQEELLREQT